MSVEFVKELDGWRGKAALVRANDGEYYAISQINTPYETLAFACDATGHVINWIDVAGGRGMTRQDVIDELSAWYDAAQDEAEA